jgi:hypothetical protein
METGGVAAKRRVLVDALTMCLSRSKVSAVVNADTLRSVLNSASGDMWREGEFRLDTVWKILTQQPGLSAAEVAPPLLVFKAYEDALGVSVRLPQALTSIPRNEQLRLRDELNITKDDFAKQVNELADLARTEQDAKAKEHAAAVEEFKTSKSTANKPAPAQIATPSAGHKQARKPMSKGVAAGIMGVALLVCGGALFFTFRSNAEPVDFADVASMLKIEQGEHVGTTWSGVINDPKWEKLTRPERQTLAATLFDHEVDKGVVSLTLRDSHGEVRVTATNLGGAKMVSAH